MTTKRTKERAELLSQSLYGEITSVCKWRIEQGEDSCKNWIKSISNKYGVIV